MSRYDQKIVQYLDEAHATEVALIRVLQSQIAMTPRGSLRKALETHLEETHDHADRVRNRVKELQSSARGNPIQAWIGLTEAVVGQALALGKAPLDMVRGNSGEEKLLKNAKDDCATEGLEIATYTAIERLARNAGDTETAELAKSILADEQRMLDRLLREIPRLTDAVARAEFDGNGSYDVTETGAADALREVRGTAKRTARQARKVPGVARAEGTVKGAVASESDLAIAKYDSLSADEILGKLAELSQVDLAKVNAYERKNQNRSTVTSRIDSLQANEPWPGYDELAVDEVRAVLSEGDDTRIKAVRTYERKHKNRAGVLQATERELSNA
jgi:ferritin-like metal-binding protein YciE